MKILVLNSGSTSVKYDLYDMESETVLARGRVERVGTADALHTRDIGAPAIRASIDAPNHRAAVAQVLASLTVEGGLIVAGDVSAVGHRVVHGGESLVAPVRIDTEVRETIERCSRFAPLHNPANLAGIDAAQAVLPGVPHVAVFDTAFHADLPPSAYLYALPYDLYLTHGIRRYGFHGPSHQYMMHAASEHLRVDVSRLKLITCHLGGGASVTAIEAGRSIETSMGMTPLEGLVMGTRSGDLDPALALLLQRDGMALESIETMLNSESGLLGLSGVSGDFRDVERAARGGNDRAKLAIEVFVHRIRKYIGAYAATLGGVDALVFTGGIGEHSATTRRAVVDGLLYMGIALDPSKNEEVDRLGERGIVDIADRHSRARVLVLATDEERMIARDVVRVLLGKSAARVRVSGKAIPVGVSVRHVHLSRTDCDTLFGEGYELTLRRPVSQPGQFVCRETVDLVGPKSELRRVAIINPLRPETQIELARSDAIALGVAPPLRESGKLAGTPGIRIRGPRGEIEATHGVIVAHRHVHMSPANAESFGVADGDRIRLRIDGDREAVFGDVLVRVRDDFALDAHVDTDEANATGLTNESVVTFDGIER